MAYCRHATYHYWNPWCPLQWHHNECDDISNHWHLDSLLNHLFRHRSKKTSSSTPLAFVRGIHRWPVNSPNKGPVMQKMFPFDDIIILSSVLPYGINGGQLLKNLDVCNKYPHIFISSWKWKKWCSSCPKNALAFDLKHDDLMIKNFIYSIKSSHSYQVCWSWIQQLI